jgi:hypothetical protein
MIIRLDFQFAHWAHNPKVGGSSEGIPLGESFPRYKIKPTVSDLAVGFLFVVCLK